VYLTRIPLERHVENVWHESRIKCLESLEAAVLGGLETAGRPPDAVLEGSRTQRGVRRDLSIRMYPLKGLTQTHTV